MITKDLKKRGNIKSKRTTELPKIPLKLGEYHCENIPLVQLEQIILELNRTAMEKLRENKRALALEQLKQAEHLLLNFDSHETNQFQSLVGITQNNLACYYKKNNKPKVALHYLMNALQIEELECMDHLSIASTYINVAVILSQLNKHQGALEHAKMGIRKLHELITREENTGEVNNMKENSINNRSELPFLLSNEDHHSDLSQSIFEQKTIDTKTQESIFDLSKNNSTDVKMISQWETDQTNINADKYKNELNLLKEKIDKNQYETILTSLVIGYFNVATEYEHLRNYRQSFNYAKQGFIFGVKYLGNKHLLTTKLNKFIKEINHKLQEKEINQESKAPRNALNSNRENTGKVSQNKNYNRLIDYTGPKIPEFKQYRGFGGMMGREITPRSRPWHSYISHNPKSSGFRSVSPYSKQFVGKEYSYERTQIQQREQGLRSTRTTGYQRERRAKSVMRSKYGGYEEDKKKNYGELEEDLLRQLTGEGEGKRMVKNFDILNLDRMNSGEGSLSRKQSGHINIAEQLLPHPPLHPPHSSPVPPKIPYPLNNIPKSPEQRMGQIRHVYDIRVSSENAYYKTHSHKPIASASNSRRQQRKNLPAIYKPPPLILKSEGSKPSTSENPRRFKYARMLGYGEYGSGREKERREGKFSSVHLKEKEGVSYREGISYKEGASYKRSGNTTYSEGNKRFNGGRRLGRSGGEEREGRKGESIPPVENLGPWGSEDSRDIDRFVYGERNGNNCLLGETSKTESDIVVMGQEKGEKRKIPWGISLDPPEEESNRETPYLPITHDTPRVDKSEVEVKVEEVKEDVANVGDGINGIHGIDIVEASHIQNIPPTSGGNQEETPKEVNRKIDNPDPDPDPSPDPDPDPREVSIKPLLISTSPEIKQEELPQLHPKYEIPKVGEDALPIKVEERDHEIRVEEEEELDVGSSRSKKESEEAMASVENMLERLQQMKHNLHKFESNVQNIKDSANFYDSQHATQGTQRGTQGTQGRNLEIITSQREGGTISSHLADTERSHINYDELSYCPSIPSQNKSPINRASRDSQFDTPNTPKVPYTTDKHNKQNRESKEYNTGNQGKPEEVGGGKDKDNYGEIKESSSSLSMLLSQDESLLSSLNLNKLYIRKISPDILNSSNQNDVDLSILTAHNLIDQRVNTLRRAIKTYLFRKTINQRIQNKKSPNI